MNRRQLLGALALLALAPAVHAQAAPKDATAARGFIQQRHESLRKAIKASADPKTDAKLLLKFDELLDYAHFSRTTLSKHWDALQPEQRKEFEAVFTRVLRAVYRQKLRDPSEYLVDYGKVEPLEERYLVHTQTSKRGTADRPLDVDYVVAWVQNRFLVQDIVTGGVSLVSNYRSQFGRIIRKQGLDALMTMLKRRLTELDG